MTVQIIPTFSRSVQPLNAFQSKVAKSLPNNTLVLVLEGNYTPREITGYRNNILYFTFKFMGV
jgi:hypothetical protein